MMSGRYVFVSTLNIEVQKYLLGATLKSIEKIKRENTFDWKKKKPGLKFNLRLALIGLRTTEQSVKQW